MISLKKLLTLFLLETSSAGVVVAFSKSNRIITPRSFLAPSSQSSVLTSSSKRFFRDPAHCRSNSVVLFAEQDDEDDDFEDDPDFTPINLDKIIEEKKLFNEPSAKEETKGDYPLNVPSPLLLASSMILGIVSIGSVFELTGGNPKLGFEPTAALVAIGLPLCGFLFYASVKKATAETEEDDKRFEEENSKKRRRRTFS